MEEIKEACGIKIGEYIRTFGYYSFISKIKRIEFDNEAQLFWFVYDKKDFDTNITREWRINKPYIKKHSQNIIDLVEKDDVGIMNCYGLLMKKFITKNDILELKSGNYKLLKVVTKEQFANAEYRLED